MADEHKAYKPAYKYHLSVGTYDNGACLMKHVVPFTDHDSCSYRWQGLKKAETQPGRAAYDAHYLPHYRIGGRGTGVFMPNATAAPTNSPGMAGIAKGLTKNKLRALVEVTNFTTASVPYGNQVHHVLNASSLRGGIDELAKNWYPIRWVIVNGLLGEKYNLNHHDNNMILPTQNKACRETGLPKHYGGHPAYSAKIRTAVDNALRPYEKIANQMKKKKNHDPLEPEKLKDALIKISNTMYASIIAEATANRLKKKLVKINDLPAAAFAGI